MAFYVPVLTSVTGRMLIAETAIDGEATTEEEIYIRLYEEQIISCLGKVPLLAISFPVSNKIYNVVYFVECTITHLPIPQPPASLLERNQVGFGGGVAHVETVV